MYILSAGGMSHSFRDRYVSTHEAQDPSMVKRILQRYMKRRFKPRLDRISEAANSALER
jgi:hypothetical protein